MSPEERQMLERALALSEENNKMLHAMRRGLWWSRVMSIIYWVFIIGSAIGAFYLIQPYINSIKSLTEDVNGQAGNTGSTQSSYDLQSLLKNFKEATQ